MIVLVPDAICLDLFMLIAISPDVFEMIILQVLIFFLISFFY